MKWADYLSPLSKQASKQASKQMNKQTQTNNNKKSYQLPPTPNPPESNQTNPQDAVHILEDILPNYIIFVKYHTIRLN